MSFAICSAVLLLAAAAESPRLEASVGAGGGYDSNLDLAASGQANIATFGSGMASAWADAGFSFDFGEATQLYTGVRYDGVTYPAATDLSHSTFGADLWLLQELTDSVAVIASSSLGHAWYGDSARDAFDFSGRATLRVKPWSWLSVRVGYGRAQVWAADSAFSTGTDRLLASVEAKLARGSFLALGYTFSTGDQVFYQPATGGGMHRGSGMFANLTPYKASAAENTISPSWEQGLWEGLYLIASYGHTWGSSQDRSYTVQSVFAGVGYHFF